MQLSCLFSHLNLFIFLIKYNKRYEIWFINTGIVFSFVSLVMKLYFFYKGDIVIVSSVGCKLHQPSPRMAKLPIHLSVDCFNVKKKKKMKLCLDFIVFDINLGIIYKVITILGLLLRTKHNLQTGYIAVK